MNSPEDDRILIALAEGNIACKKLIEEYRQKSVGDDEWLAMADLFTEIRGRIEEASDIMMKRMIRTNLPIAFPIN